MTRYYKWLKKSGEAIWGTGSWSLPELDGTPGQWMPKLKQWGLRPCESGYHAFTAEDLIKLVPVGGGHVLVEVQLVSPIMGEGKWLAAEARALRVFHGWTPTAYINDTMEDRLAADSKIEAARVIYNNELREAARIFHEFLDHASAGYRNALDNDAIELEEREKLAAFYYQDRRRNFEKEYLFTIGRATEEYEVAVILATHNLRYAVENLLDHHLPRSRTDPGQIAVT